MVKMKEKSVEVPNLVQKTKVASGHSISSVGAYLLEIRFSVIIFP